MGNLMPSGNTIPSNNRSFQVPSWLALKILIVALAYFVAGRLGLSIPYLDSHITLIWLPTGIAVAALLRWGYYCWPGVFIGAFITNYSVDAFVLLDTCIALGNTLGPLLVVWLLRRFNFQSALEYVNDILLLLVGSAIGMLAGASGGVASLLLLGQLPVHNAGAAWFSWWAGDLVGVLLAAPLLLNLTRTELEKLWPQRMEFLLWCLVTFIVSWGVFFTTASDHGHLLPLAFIVMPTAVWAAMRFGLAGSSLCVLLLAGIAALATSTGSGPFYTGGDRYGPILMWLFFVTLIFLEMTVLVLQAGRKRAEEVFRLNYDFSNELIQSLPGAFYLLDKSGRFLMWNRQLETVLHCSAEEIARSHPLDFFEGNDRGLIEENIRKVFESGETAVEAVLVAKNGMKVPYYFTGRRIDRYGEPVLVGMGVDITDRINSERFIQEARNRLEFIFNSSPVASLISRVSDGIITEVNERFCQHSGFDREQIIGSTTTELNFWIDPADRERFLRALQATGSCHDFEADFRNRDGELYIGLLSAGVTAIQGVPHIVSTIRDITESKRLQQESEVLLMRYQALMQSAFDGIHVMDDVGNIVDTNASFCRMLGYTPEEMSGMNVADWDVQWSREELMGRFKKLVRVGSALFETRHRRKDGGILDVEVSTTGVEIDGKFYLFASSRDITERKEAERMLASIRAREAEALQELRVMLNISGEGFWKADTSGTIIEVNDAYCYIVGYDRSEVVGANISKFEDVEPTTELVARHIRRIMEIGTDRFETKHRHRDGHLIDMEIVASYIEETNRVVAFMHDVTERKQIEDILRIAAITFDTQEGIMITDPDANILRVNQAFEEITGYGVNEVIGRNPRFLQSGRHDDAFYKSMWSELLATGKWAGEIWDKRKNGEIYPKTLTITASRNELKQVTHYVAVFRDISRRKKTEQEIHQLAFYDSLTQLPNRRLLLDRLQQALGVSARNGRHGALLFLDLDHFKTINDTQGHAMGDRLLIEAARRLQTCVREGDSVARLGGDEFVVLLEDMSSEADEAATQTEMVAEKIRMVLDQPYLLGEFECLSTVSIGISLFLKHQESADNLLKFADVAMYQAKTSGRNTIRFFDPRMQMALEARAALEADLRVALEKQQFCLYYQIQVDDHRRTLGAEVLLRWQHPERGVIEPESFIPLAEETGLIVPIGLWVLQSACVQLKAWQNDATTRDLILAVNVSAKQFRQPDFVSQVKDLLKEIGVPASHLKLELTESTVLENVEDTIRTMQQLKDLGVAFSMDDFGTGYSSLQYLKRLPLDQVKIDRSFVHDITANANDAAIVQTIIAMTEALGFGVIAEGVETESQLTFLDLRGCHAFQGFLFSEPVPLEEFERLLVR